MIPNGTNVTNPGMGNDPMSDNELWCVILVTWAIFTLVGMCFVWPCSEYLLTRIFIP